MATYLVTGGAGFIGSNIVRALLKNEKKVRVIDNFLTGRKENISSFLDKIELVVSDIRDLETLKKTMKGVDFVLHQAALCSIVRSMKDPSATNLNNIDGTLNVLIAAKEAGVKRVVFASSSSVYGDTKILPKTEEMQPNPCSPYAVSKLTGELYSRVFYKNYGLETIILRYFNVFGTGQDSKSEYAAVIPRFIDCLLKGRGPVIFGDGSQTRDFTFVDNVVQANLKACHAPSEACGEVFNIACGKKVSINQLLFKLKKILKKDVQPVYQASRKGEVVHSLADIAKARKFLGYKPEVNLDRGLEFAVKWHEKNKEKSCEFKR